MQGILTSADVDQAMVSIGIDLVSALSMGLGRIVTAPGAAARFGARFVVLSRITQGVRVAATAGDVWQALTVTESFTKAFDAVNSQPGLSDNQRNKMRAQLIRRALLTGAMMTIAIKGDISELRSGGNLRVSHVDADGALVPHGKGEGAAAVPHAALHTEVSGPTHVASQRAGNGLTLGAETHAVGVAGSGPMRDIYFCSDRCTSLTARIAPVVDALPERHSASAAFKHMLEKARKAQIGLADGSVTREQADAVAEETLRRIRALAADTNDGRDVRRLLDMDPAVLDATSAAERSRIAREQGIRLTQGEEQAQRQQAARQAGRRASPEGGPPPLEADTLKTQGVTPSETLPDAPVKSYSARPADKPYFAGPQGIPSAEGDRIAQSLRQLLNVTDGNVAVAEAFINGERQLLTATSGGTTPPGTVALPDKTQFRVVNSGAMSRATDTEAKILEHLADRLPPDAKGTITIFTELAPCNSCSGVIAQFKERFPGITVIVTHR